MVTWGYKVCTRKSNLNSWRRQCFDFCFLQGCHSKTPPPLWWARLYSQGGPIGKRWPAPHSTSLSLHIKPVTTVDVTFVPSFCEMMSLHVKQGISMKKDILLTFLFSLRRICFLLHFVSRNCCLHRRNLKKKKRKEKNMRRQKQTCAGCVNGHVLCRATLSVSERVWDTKHAWEICSLSYKSKISFFSKPTVPGPCCRKCL